VKLFIWKSILSDEAKAEYPNNIPWRKIASTRDRLIHFYFGVNIDIIWDIAKNEILLLSAQLEAEPKSGF
jgi:uncharacterized protein with HEPN domain